MKIKDIEWTEEQMPLTESILYSYFISKEPLVRITVLNRMTGFGWRDIETGYMDKDKKFCLASGNFDIRKFPDLTVEQAINKIKEMSNTCQGD